MARGLLVSYAGYPYALSSLFPDNGLASLAAVLRREGHACQVLDFNTVDLVERLVHPEARAELSVIARRLESGLDPADTSRLVTLANAMDARGIALAEEIGAGLARRCQTEAIDFVGFKLWTGDGFDASIAIASVVRAACPQVKLFAGGPAVHYCAHIVPREAPIFDAVINGDGEEAIVELARYCEGKRPLEGIPNRITAEDTRWEPKAFTDLRDLPPLDYSPETYPSLYEGKKIKLLGIDESRGCPTRCTFCVNWHVEGARWRARDPRAIVDEIEALKRTVGTRAFRFSGTFTPPAVIYQVSELLIERALDVRFSLYLHPGSVDDEMLALLERAGCFGVFFGVETANATLRREAMGKRMDDVKVRRALQRALERGLFTAASFIYPSPGETEATEGETRALISEVFGDGRNGAAVLNFPGLIPGTTWWDYRDAYGFELDIDDDDYRRLVLRYKIKHLLPASVGAPLPVRLDGRTHAEVVARCAALQKWVLEQEIALNLPDHDALIASALDEAPARFQRRLKRAIFTGDGDALRDIVQRANDGFAT